MTHRPGCPYAGFDAAKHARECGECDPRELEERCGCRTGPKTLTFAAGKGAAAAQTITEAVASAVRAAEVIAREGGG